MAFSVMSLFVTQQSGAQTINFNQTGTNNDFYFSYWNQGAESTTFTGTPIMTLGAAGNYSVTWTNVNNFTAGKGWATGSPNRVINFSGSFDGGSNGYLAVYGWTKNALIEYYVVESYGAWTPPGGTSKGSFTSDGGTYNIYETTRINQPSIVGPATFQQYWSVRTSRRSSGTVTLSNHIAAWAAKGMIMGSIWDYQIMETEGYHSSGSSNITMSEGTLTNVIEETTPNKAINVFPNPTTDKFAFTLPDLQSDVYLLSISGAQLMALKPEKTEVEIDLSKFEAGIYILKIVTEGQIITKKIVKQ